MKKVFFILLLAFATSLHYGQNTYQLSSHILDISTGTGAAGVEIQLEKFHSASKSWKTIDKKRTDSNGRIKDFLPKQKNNDGIYKLVYWTAPYFASKNQKSFYPFIEVVFEISDQTHYHVPITLSPFGYSTYRGN